MSFRVPTSKLLLVASHTIQVQEPILSRCIRTYHFSLRVMRGWTSSNPRPGTIPMSRHFSWHGSVRRGTAREGWPRDVEPAALFSFRTVETRVPAPPWQQVPGRGHLFRTSIQPSEKVRFGNYLALPPSLFAQCTTSFGRASFHTIVIGWSNEG